MKQIVCEVCGSNELVKEDGYFICQYCGAKYSPEDAKHLIVEVNGKVDVSGSKVTVDNTSFVERSLENARRAKAKEDWEECEKYYNMVEQYEPTNIEAIFYSSYGKARMALVDSDRFKREQKIKVLKHSISIIDDNYDDSPQKYEENKKLIQQISADLLSFMKSSFVMNTKTEMGNSGNTYTTNDGSYTYDMFIELSLGMIESVEHIIHTIRDKNKTIHLWKIIRQQYEYIYSVCRRATMLHNYKNKKQWLEAINRTDEKIKQLDPNYIKNDLKQLPMTENDFNMTVGAVIAIIIIAVIVIYYISQSM
ncbi:TFIIB-type zinc finger domain-containing protein [Ruminococcus sp.]|uniref:TFIIB-type zinc finger domain-containing protein n=1 Tax=Ruminococcus sp. TaxID=41978 RepID=UPI0025CCF6D7|nr:TFIIB-type zinc finger domain-containing protein [Ruminococcus sp.]